jgi:hypothetical protein
VAHIVLLIKIVTILANLASQKIFSATLLGATGC